MILIAGLLLLTLTPPVVVLLWVIDLVQSNPRGRLVRLWLFVVGAIWVEIASAAGCTWLWVIHFGGRRSKGWLAANWKVEFWWCRWHMANFRRWAAVRILYPDPTETEIANSIVVARHASHVDALAPLDYIANVAHRVPLYTLKQELQWAPAMDIVGNRTHNVWLDRAPEPGSPIFKSVENLAAVIDDTSAAVIFPEGTFFTADRRDRAAARLGQHRPDLEEQARSLRYLLPPRPAGTLILLRGAPEADLVIMANVGLEEFGSIKEIVANIAVPKTIEVRFWRYRRADLPSSEHEITGWLLDRWSEMDAWIHERLAARSPAVEIGARS